MNLVGHVLITVSATALVIAVGILLFAVSRMVYGIARNYLRERHAVREVQHPRFGLLTGFGGVWSGKTRKNGREIPFTVSGSDSAPAEKLLRRIDAVIGRFADVERRGAEHLRKQEAEIGDAALEVYSLEVTDGGGPDDFTLEFLADGDDSSVWRFLLRRGFKIYPPFWIFLAFIISWELWKGLAVTIDDILPDLFFFQNYTPGVWGTNWSLGVEEHFYLLMPLSLLLLGHFGRHAERPFQHFPWIFAGVAITCLALRWWNAPSRFSNFTHLTPTHLRIDGLFFGTLLAYYHVYAHESFLAFCRRFRWWLLAAGVAGFLPPFFLLLEFSWYMKVFGFVAQWLGAGALICFALVRSSPPGASMRAVAAIGRTSYATYLWHYWIGLYGLRDLAGVFGFHWSWPIFTLVYYTSTISAGFLLTRWIESPFLRLRDRFVPADTRAARATRDGNALSSPASLQMAAR